MNIKNSMLYLALVLSVSPVWAESAPTQVEGFNLNSYEETGKKAWEINGDKADITEEKINITNVNANFYDEKQNANLTSKSGTIDKVNGDVHLQDDVVITAEQGTIMTTDSLDWSRNKDVVKTDDLVTIEDKQGTVSGVGLTGHPNLKKAQLNSDVKAVIKTPESKKGPSQTVQITCDGPMQMDQVKMYAVFNKNVVAIEETTGRELRADTMQVWFDDKNKKIKKLICKGNVSVIQGDNASYADEMVYNGADQTLVMTGRPKLVFDTGDKEGAGIFQSTGQN
jgi:LPS export ABC transporter protein LptC